METAEHRLLARLAAHSAKWPPRTARVLAVLSVPFLGVADYLSGPDVAFAVFYLVPLSVIGWLSSRSRFFPWTSSVLAALTWLAADLGAGAEYSMWVIPLWNTTSRLVIFLVVVMLLQNLQSALAEQRHLAESDSLTGIANGRTFMTALGTEVRRTRRQPGPLSLAYIDVDDFKTINDTHGHSGGDDVLQRLAAALDGSTRDIDLVGRLGGDEFAILLPMTDVDGAKVVIEGLRKRVDSAMKAVGFTVTLSMGCVTFTGPPAGAGEVLHAADELMYEVKQSGKDSALHKVVTSLSNVDA